MQFRDLHYYLYKLELRGIKLKLSEYICECDYCGSETRVVVVDEREEPSFCSMCGQVSGHAFFDGDDDEEF